MGVGSAFAGDRATNLNRLAVELALAGGVQLIFLMDGSEWDNPKRRLPLDPVADALPHHLRPLVVPYTEEAIRELFPIRHLDKPGRARAMSKYYETYAWTWWWHKAYMQKMPPGMARPARVWVMEDDVVFSGAWSSLFGALTAGLDAYEASPAVSGGRVDLVAFREYCTPLEGWPWWHWMPEVSGPFLCSKIT